MEHGEMKGKNMAKKTTRTTAPKRAPISSQNEIDTFLHCGLCLEELNAGVGKFPAGVPRTAQHYARLEVGYTPTGLQVRCVRHDVNVIHLDFAGQKFHANTSRACWACPECGAGFQKHGTGPKARAACKFPPEEKRTCMGFRCYCRNDVPHSHAKNKDCPKAHCGCCGYLGPFTEKKA